MEWFGQYTYGDQHCPKCRSSDIVQGGHIHDIRYNGDPEDDPSLHLRLCKCVQCDIDFARQWIPRSRSAWVSLLGEGKQVYVVAGYPDPTMVDCFVHCGCCGGWAKSRPKEARDTHIPLLDKGQAEPPRIWECACGYSGVEMPRTPKPKPKTAWERILLGPVSE